MGIEKTLREKISTLNIEVDKTVTIKGAISLYDPSQASKFNRANSATFRSEFFIYEDTDYENILNEFKDASNAAFREDQTLILKADNQYFVYQNRDFNSPMIFNDENEVIKFLFPQEVNIEVSAKNTIYFGSPGTGKSHEVNQLTNGTNVRQVTFHPEYDYSSFVGGYKPSMNGTDIVYEFVPQIFTNIYVEAWKNLTEHYFLQIEEINRGNCAEIFGDLFQLLDRADDGSSEYGVDASEDLYQYLVKELEEKGYKGIGNKKIKLPSNLSIIATMNTSDQSLFPMDSAFKRRWDWKYVPIDYSNTNPSANFIIELDNGATYKWLEFLKAVNKKIVEATESQDKQLGNWFVKPKSGNIITEEMFINKILFYLWNDVFKDEEKNLFQFTFDDQLLTMSYEDFFTINNNSNLVTKLMTENLELSVIEETAEAANIE
jgi:5-methylcytosine-specific restriction endonuclease McrBC GTP-binding regulatory subunit McrB